MEFAANLHYTLLKKIPPPLNKVEVLNVCEICKALKHIQHCAGVGGQLELQFLRLKHKVSQTF